MQFYQVEDILNKFSQPCFFFFFVWPPAVLEGPLSFHLSRCLYVHTDVQMYVCVDVAFSSTSKGKSLLCYENAMTDFRQTWYVGSEGHKNYPSGLLSLNAHI